MIYTYIYIYIQEIDSLLDILCNNYNQYWIDSYRINLIKTLILENELDPWLLNEKYHTTFDNIKYFDKYNSIYSIWTKHILYKRLLNDTRSNNIFNKILFR